MSPKQLGARLAGVSSFAWALSKFGRAPLDSLAGVNSLKRTLMAIGPSSERLASAAGSLERVTGPESILRDMDFLKDKLDLRKTIAGASNERRKEARPANGFPRLCFSFF